MEFFGVGIGEAGLILLITLLVVGPNRFPHIAREAGKWYRTIREYADAVMGDVQVAIKDLEEEVNAQGAADDLRSIREIGRDIKQIGSETRDAAKTTEPDEQHRASGQ